MEQLITDRLRDNLTRLNLNRASEVLQTIAEQSETDKLHHHHLQQEVHRLAGALRGCRDRHRHPRPAAAQLQGRQHQRPQLPAPAARLLNPKHRISKSKGTGQPNKLPPPKKPRSGTLFNYRNWTTFKLPLTTEPGRCFYLFRNALNPPIVSSRMDSMDPVRSRIAAMWV
jgi:hypothetical protein